MLQILFCVIVLLAFYNFYWKRRNLPPGPTPLPFIGNLQTISRLNGQQAFYQWREQYGDLFTVWYGEDPVIMLNDSPTIYDTFVKDGEAYAGRPKGFLHSFNGEPNLGLGFTDGPIWKEQRRFALQVLREFGMGKNLMQERVLEEVSTTISAIKEEIEKENEKVDITNIMDMCVGSIINSLTFGYRFDKSNVEEFQKLKYDSKKTIVTFMDPLWQVCLWKPDLLKHIPPFKKVYEHAKFVNLTIDEVFKDKLKKRRTEINLEADEEPRDFADAFLKKQYQLEKSGETNHTYCDKQLIDSAATLWSAGQETTSAALAWLFLHLMENPEAQQKAHEELDKFVGSDRYVTLDDKQNLNYINAIVAETLRFGDGGSINIFHRTTKEVEIKGYKLPENTLIANMMWLVNHDSRYFPEPDKFMPERFLDKDGKFSWPKELMPFSVGKRACLGEGLAKLEMYLFAANLLNHFKFNHPKNGKADLEFVIDDTYPKPYTSFVEKRRL